MTEPASNAECWYEGDDTTAAHGPVFPLDGTWRIRCNCGWERVYPYSEENYNQAAWFLAEHREPRPDEE